jgi:hypothetical protein
MNRFQQITHDHAGRLGIILGFVGGCAAVLLSTAGKVMLFQRHHPRRSRRHVTYPERVSVNVMASAGC